MPALTSDVLVLPDSGSKPNLLSWKFVKEKGLEELIKWDNERLLQFADRNLEKIQGSIRTRWRFASNLQSRRSSIKVESHVSRNCVYDVIIGQAMLEETDAFLGHKKDFIYIESNPESAGINLVIFAPDRAKKSSSLLTADNAVHAELQRRARALKMSLAVHMMSVVSPVMGVAFSHIPNHHPSHLIFTQIYAIAMIVDAPGLQTGAIAS
ncbi:hypothetical protein F4815DRAFT_490237 [Daldinia loculata]|nr:hypothetical protein F4815DRAFT_490237 [Daldinia loculata]